MNLNEINRDLPFKVPDNYFNTLPDKILDQCLNEKAEEKQKSSVLYILKPALSLAAMFIGFAVIAYLAISLTGRPANTEYPDDIAKANYEELYKSEQELIDATIEKPEELNTEEETNEYIDYLLNEEDIDYGTLINELREEEKDTSNK